MAYKEVPQEAIALAGKIIDGYEGLGGWSILKQRYFPYHCSADAPSVMTVGRGHKVLPGEDFSKGLTLAEVDLLFAKDLAERIEWLHKYLVLNKINYSINLFAGLLSLLYNGGPAPLYGSPMQYLRKGDTLRACERIMLYHKSGEPLRPRLGLWRRKGTEVLVILTGKVMVAKNPITEKLLFMELDKCKVSYVRPAKFY